MRPGVRLRWARQLRASVGDPLHGRGSRSHAHPAPGGCRDRDDPYGRARVPRRARARLLAALRDSCKAARVPPPDRL